MTDVERTPSTAYLALILVALGLVLITCSFASFSFLSRRAWTIADSEAFGQVTRGLHDSTMTLSRDSVAADRHRAQLEREYERLSTKLAVAQNEPRRWSRWLLWTGGALTATGALIHQARRRE